MLPIASYQVMEKLLRSKKILKPDVPPPRDAESLEGLGHSLIIAALVICGIAGVIAIILMVI